MLHYLKARTGDKRLRCVTKEEEMYLGAIFYFKAMSVKRLKKLVNQSASILF